MRKILVCLVCFILVGNVFCSERVRRKMDDGKYRFFDKVSEIRYDERGNKIYTLDESGRESFFKYDENNNLLNDGDYDYTYDENGNLLSKKYVYDEFFLEEYKYDENGNKTEFINKCNKYDNGTVYHYEYNDQGKLCKITQEGSEDTGIFDYDENGNMIYEYNPFAENGYSLGREYIYEYDDKNRVVAIIDKDNFEISLKYDENGNLIEENYGLSFRDCYYEYDDHNRLLSKKTGDDLIEFSCKYNDDGLIMEEFKKESNEPVNYKYEYNDKGLMSGKTKQCYSHVTNFVFEYEFYDNGDIKSVCEYKYSGGN